MPISSTTEYTLLAPMITDVNPFVYSRPIAPDDVIDRDDETQRLLTAAVGGHYVRLYAPRKYGKTSLLRRVLRDAERSEGMIPILVDLYGVLSVADVAIRFERAYARQLKGKARTRIEEFLQSTGLGLAGRARDQRADQLQPRTDPLPALHALLDLPLRLEESGGFRALIVLDEFQDITKVKEMDAVLRSHIQLQGEVASFVFAGSEPGLMRELFEDRERPLYGQAVPMRLGRLADPDIAAYVAERFRETGRSAGEALNRCWPPRAAIRSGRCCSRTGSGRRWRRRPRPRWPTGTRAHAAAHVELQPEFDANWRRLSTSAQKTLRAVVAGGGSPFRTRVLEQLDLPKSTPAPRCARSSRARSSSRTATSTSSSIPSSPSGSAGLKGGRHRWRSDMKPPHLSPALPPIDSGGGGRGEIVPGGIPATTPRGWSGTAWSTAVRRSIVRPDERRRRRHGRPVRPRAGAGRRRAGAAGTASRASPPATAGS